MASVAQHCAVMEGINRRSLVAGCRSVAQGHGICFAPAIRHVGGAFPGHLPGDAVRNKLLQMRPCKPVCVNP